MAIRVRSPSCCSTQYFPCTQLSSASLVDARKRAQTYYGLTNARAIILSIGEPTNLRAVDLKLLKEITFIRRSDHTGTLEFDRPGCLSYRRRLDMKRGANSPWMSMDPLRTPAFEMIANPHEVYDLIVQTQHALQTP